jgi:hypothetical protein
VSSMISNALDFLYRTVHSPAVAGELVAYSNGIASVNVNAVLERAESVPPNLAGLAPGQYDLASPSPLNIDHDFSILAADLVLPAILGGTPGPWTPQRGDTITRTFNGLVSTYQLVAGTNSTAIWQWQDGYDRRYLIHTQFTEAVAAT